MIKSHVLYRLSYGLTEGALVFRGRRRVKGVRHKTPRPVAPCAGIDPNTAGAHHPGKE